MIDQIADNGHRRSEPASESFVISFATYLPLSPFPVSSVDA